MLTAVYRIDPQNIGDMSSSPVTWLDFGTTADEIDISSPIVAEGKPVAGKIVMGGGGLLFDPDKIQKFVARNVSKIILWGVGVNNYEKLDTPPGWLRHCRLVGIRDVIHGWNWVPCASCMSPLLDHTLIDKIQHPVVFYGHKDKLGLYDDGIRYMHNDAIDMRDVVNFLASGETVITNSYHGAYWATLLGRKVLLLEPWSSKFGYLRHPHVVTSRFTWREDIKHARRYATAISDCRDATKKFFQTAMEIIHA